MMIPVRRVVLLAVIPVLSQAGCVFVNWTPRVWTQVSTEKLPIDTTDLRALEVRTHNGTITFKGQVEKTADAYVTVTKKASGRDPEDAEAALAALNVFVEDAGDGTQRIGWRWNGTRRDGWGARVSFDVRAPRQTAFDGHTHNGNVKIEQVKGAVRAWTHNGSVTVREVEGSLNARTHNGRIKIEDVTGDARVGTYNGSVTAKSTGGNLYARTHNGGLNVAYVGSDLTLQTHNGRVVADLSRCGAVNSTIRTHNGSIDVLLGPKASAQLTCRTHNGRLRCDVPLENLHASRRNLSGLVGAGEGKLDLSSYNSGIRIKKLTD